MKKLFYVMFAMVLILAGCSSNTVEEKLVVWGAVAPEDGPQGIIDAWNSENPEMPAEYVVFTNDDTGNAKLDTALASGEQIDVFFSYQPEVLFQRIKSGTAAELSSEATSWMEENIASLDQIQSYQDKFYTMPTTLETSLLMINQDALTSSGYSLPTEGESWTFEEYKQIAEDLTTDEMYGTVAVSEEYLVDLCTPAFASSPFYSADGKSSNFDNPCFQNWLDMNQLMTDGIAFPYEDLLARGMTTYSHPVFLNGEVAMIPARSWMTRYVLDTENYPHDFKVGFAPLPSVDENTENAYQSQLNNYMSVSSASEHQSDAERFIEFWIENSVDYIKKVPAYNKISDEQMVQAALGEDAEQYFDVESFVNVIFNPNGKSTIETYTNGANQLKDMLKEEQQKLMLGEETEDVFMVNIKTKGDDIISSNA